MKPAVSNRRSWLAVIAGWLGLASIPQTRKPAETPRLDPMRTIPAPHGYELVHRARDRNRNRQWFSDGRFKDLDEAFAEVIHRGCGPEYLVRPAPADDEDEGPQDYEGEAVARIQMSDRHYRRLERIIARFIRKHCLIL